MNSAKEARKAALTRQVVSNIKKQLGAGKAKMAASYVEQCFRRVPVEDLILNSPQTLAAIVMGQLEFIKTRAPGEVLVRVFNPRLDTDGWESPHTIIEMVNDDRSFLVDSVSLTCSEMDLGIHLIIHPVIRIGRDDKGRLTAVYSNETRKGLPESIMQFQVDRRTGAADMENIRSRLIAVFRDVRWAVEDWRKMEDRAGETAQQMVEWGAKTDPGWMEEYQAFLDWLHQEHFVFLGARDYVVVRDKKEGELQIV
ncbi:MAG: NAD-glutamate dehydrogenase, partial [Xanthomonadales bacterium]|nr:NAD-glutamate dehydrogenase [Xanthomonadales bacterium]